MNLPPRWGDDELSSFMATAFGNTLATFVRKRPEFDLLIRTDAIFHKIADGSLNNPSNFLAALLFPRAHSAYRAACRLAVSGQIPETSVLLRSCIEYALYALHVEKNLPLAEVWLRRNDDDAARKACRQSFQHVKVIKTLADTDAQLHRAIDGLYERSIEFGAHPNEGGVTGSTTLQEEPDRKTFQGVYLHADGVPLSYAMKACAQVGVGALSIFEHIFRDRFRLLAMDVELQKLRQVL